MIGQNNDGVTFMASVIVIVADDYLIHLSNYRNSFALFANKQNINRYITKHLTIHWLLDSPIIHHVENLYVIENKSQFKLLRAISYSIQTESCFEKCSCIETSVSSSRKAINFISIS